jgi:hypothetical protein
MTVSDVPNPNSSNSSSDDDVENDTYIPSPRAHPHGKGKGLASASDSMSHPGSEKIKPKPLYVGPAYSNHMYSEQYDKQIQYLNKLQAKLLQNY